MKKSRRIINKTRHARKKTHKRTSKRKNRKTNKKSYKSRGGMETNSPMKRGLRLNAPEFIPTASRLNPAASEFIPTTNTTLPQETVFDPEPITLNERINVNANQNAQEYVSNIVNSPNNYSNQDIMNVANSTYVPTTYNTRPANYSMNEANASNAIMRGSRIGTWRENRGRMVNSLKKQGSKLPNWLNKNNNFI
jgi:hypothetical protein